MIKKETVEKIIKIKKMQYEVFKDIIPEKAKSKLEEKEDEVINLVKEIAYDFIINKDNCESKEKKRHVNKVKVEF